MKWQDMKTTLDVLNYAFQLVSEVSNAKVYADYTSAKEEGKRLERFINGHLESGCHVGQARHELRLAKYYATHGIDTARAYYEFQKGWRKSW